MYKEISALTVTFVAGLTVGLLLDTPSSRNPNNNDPGAVTTEVKKNIPGNPEIKTKKEDNSPKKQIVLQTQKNNNQYNQISKKEILPEQQDLPSQEDPYEILAKFPPPHVVDPNFYGPEPNEEEVLRNMEQSLEELVYSMREAGLPYDDIEAVINEHNQATEQILSSGEAGDNEQEKKIVTSEQQAHELAQSMWDETDEPAENIDEMTQDLLSFASETEAEPENFDPETGLDHPEPTIE